jgi:pimeloyl-ACP methyl ester carboxylesterase
LAVAVAAAALTGTPSVAGAASADKVITAPRKSTYVVRGKTVSMTCRGRGRTPVVLLAGGDDPGSYWDGLVESLGPKVLTCVFDRPGIGASSPSAKPLTPDAVGDALAATLAQAHLGRRVVLVGHSIGGANALVYGAAHPKAVAGAVLIDPSQAAFFKATNAAGVLTSLGYAPKATGKQIAAVKRWPNVPLVVLSRDPRKAVADNQATAAQEAVWIAGAKKYAKLSKKGSRTVVPGSTHYIHLDAPQAATAAVRQVLAQAR